MIDNGQQQDSKHYRNFFLNPSQKKRVLIWLLKKCWLLFAFSIIGLALLISVTRLLIPFVPDYQPRIETWLSEQLHMPVKVGTINAYWRGFHPVIQFENIVFYHQEQKKQTAINKISVGIDLTDSVIKRKISTASMTLSGLSLTLEKGDDGRYQIKEFKSQDTPIETAKIANWLLSQQRFVLENISLKIEQKNKVIEIKNVNLKLANQGEKHRLDGSLLFNNSLQSQLNFSVKAEGDLKNAKQREIKFNIRGNDVLLETITSFIAIPMINIQSGVANFMVNGAIHGETSGKMQSDFKIRQLKLWGATTEEVKSLQQILGSLTANYEEKQGWQVNIYNLNIVEDDDSVWPTNEIHVNANKKADEEGVELGISTDFIRLSLLQWFLYNMPSQLNPKIISALNPTGDIGNVEMDLFCGSQNKLKRLSFIFNQLSWGAWNKIPAMKNISGQLSLNETNGEIKIHSTDVQIDLLHIFRKPLFLSTLNAEIDWTKGEEALRLRIPYLQTNTAISASSAEMILTIPYNNDSPEIELLGRTQFQEFGPNELMNYLPVGIIPAPVVSWLDKSIKKSGALDATVILNGPLRSFPFDDYSGTFIIDAKVQDTNIDYHQGWPVLKHLKGDLRFEGRKMQANIESGTIGKNDIKKLSAKIDRMSMLKPVVLEIEGQVQGDLQQGLHFIHNSPLQSSIGKRIKNIEARGPMSVLLSLDIPLSTGKSNAKQKLPPLPVKVSGNLSVYNAALDFIVGKIHATNINGELQFTEGGLFAQNVHGVLYGYPIDIQVDTEKNKRNETVTKIHGKGSASIDALQQNYNLSLSEFIQGRMNYQFQLDLTDKSTNQLHLSSDLIGISSHFLGDLEKKAEEPLLTEVDLQFLKNGNLELYVDLNKKVNGIFQFKENEKTMLFNKGHIYFGEKKAVLPSKSGLTINGTIDAVDVDSFKKIQVSMKEKDNNFLKRYGKYLQEIDLRINKLTVFKTLVKNMRINIGFNTTAVLIKLTQEKIKGQIAFPISSESKSIDINLDYLKLDDTNAAQKNQEKSEKITLKNWPVINFLCKKFQYGKKQLGEVRFSITPIEKGLLIQNIQVKSSSFLFLASSQWIENQGKQTTTLTGKVTSNDVKRTLKELAMPDNLYSKNASINFDLQWPNAPFAFNLHNIAGNLSLHIKEGRIEGLSKEAAMKLSLGRLITLLSLESLPKRLQLDFSDLTNSGYNFNSMEGNFVLNEGNLKTNDATLNGTVAKVTMKGQVGLENKNYDLDLVITPNMTSSLPIVATIAGGPVAGVVTWLVNEALSPEVNKLTRHEYKIKGSWDKPIVTPMKTYSSD